MKNFPSIFQVFPITMVQKKRYHEFKIKLTVLKAPNHFCEHVYLFIMKKKHKLQSGSVKTDHNTVLTKQTINLAFPATAFSVRQPTIVHYFVFSVIDQSPSVTIVFY